LNEIIEESRLVLCVTIEQTEWTFVFVFCSISAKYLKVFKYRGWYLKVFKY